MYIMSRTKLIERRHQQTAATCTWNAAQLYVCASKPTEPQPSPGPLHRPWLYTGTVALRTVISRQYANKNTSWPNEDSPDIQATANGLLEQLEGADLRKSKLCLGMGVGRRRCSFKWSTCKWWVHNRLVAMQEMVHASVLSDALPKNCHVAYRTITFWAASTNGVLHPYLAFAGIMETFIWGCPDASCSQTLTGMTRQKTRVA